MTLAPRRAAMRATQKPWPPAWRWISGSSPGLGSTVIVTTGDGAKTDSEHDTWGSSDNLALSGIRESLRLPNGAIYVVSPDTSRTWLRICRCAGGG